MPVLLHQTINALRPVEGDVVVDCTLGFGGHAREFLKRIGPNGTLIGLDMDLHELERTRKRFNQSAPNIRFLHANYRDVSNVLKESNIRACDILFADLGVSSMQVDDATRGISYRSPGPLDMRMNPQLQQTGSDLLATISKNDLSNALWELSDEPDHDRIAQFIVNQRSVEPIDRVEQLVRLVFAAKNTTEKAWKKQARFKDLHPAARTFQTLRILVNDELASLEALLEQAPGIIKSGGRFGVISFHSGEDRLVKRALREGYANGTWSATSVGVIRPTASETCANPRSSSAKFRWAIRA